MAETIYEAAWEELLPENLTRDPSVLATVRAIAEEKRKVAAEIWRTRVWLTIRELPEEVLDALAYDLKVDWYDYNYPLEVKQQTVLDAARVHRYIGTRYAVEQAISAVWSGTLTQEWWEYGADPYHFRVRVDAIYLEDDRTAHEDVVRRVEYYKNVRSVFDGVIYVRSRVMDHSIYTGFALRLGRKSKVECNIPEDLDVEYLLDENGTVLTDEADNRYIDEEEES